VVRGLSRENLEKSERVDGTRFNLDIVVEISKLLDEERFALLCALLRGVNRVEVFRGAIDCDEEGEHGERGVFHAPIITHSRRIARGKKKKFRS
jgi:hypothetical protein